MFEGASALALDSKGRMSVPTAYRALIKENGDGNVVVTLDKDDSCLLLYTEFEWKVVQEKLSRLPSFNEHTRKLMRIIVGHASKVKMDSNNRILIPPLLREIVNIDKSIALIGMTNKFEIWDEQTWARKLEEMKNKEISDEVPLEIATLSI